MELFNLLLWLIAASIIARAGYALYVFVRNNVQTSALAWKQGCMSPPKILNRWPLGIDRIKDLWQADTEGRLLPYLCKVAEEHEPRKTLTQYLLFGPRAFHILDPLNIEVVLSKNFQEYGLGVRQDVFSPLIQSGISTQEGPCWRRSRQAVRKTLVCIRETDLHCLEEHITNLITRLPLSGVVDLQPLLFDMTFDVATALFFGRSVYSLRAGLDQSQANKEFAQSFNTAQEGLAKRFRIAPWHAFYSPQSFKTACTNVHRFVDNYIKHLDLHDLGTDMNEDRDFAKPSATDFTPSCSRRDQLLNMLIAGRDTTACCLSWTFRLLIRHQHVLTKLREEIESVMGRETAPSREQLRQMSYLSCVIKESLRLYPPVPLNTREATQTSILPTGGGPDGDHPILVRKGEMVYFSQYVLSRKESIFGADAHEFRPERWEGTELADVGWGYSPFSGGPRHCLGEDFALTEVSYTILRVLQTFPGITIPVGESITPLGEERQQLTLVLLSSDGCRVQLDRDPPA